MRVLRESIRVKAGRNKLPSASIIDSQSSKRALISKNVGYDGAKKIKGRKRHLAVDVLGLPLPNLAHSTGIFVYIPHSHSFEYDPKIFRANVRRSFNGSIDYRDV